MSSFVEGQVHQLMDRLERAGFTAKHLTALGQHKDLGLFLDVLDGRAEIKLIEYLIDFDKAPSIPDGWTLLPESEQLPNRIRGKVKFDPTKIKLHLDDDQRGGRYITGDKLHKKLTNVPVLGAQALDFYLANPHLIPEEWKGKTIFFWGSIYRRADGSLCVRYLFWADGRWCSDYDWLDYRWADCSPFAVFAS